MTYFVFHQSEGFDRKTAQEFDTRADAGREILAYDQQSSGIEEIDGEFVPWQLSMGGHKTYLRPFARPTEREALEAISYSTAFHLECITAVTAAEIEAAAND